VAQSINDDNFGAWVIKCDPKVWDLKAFLDAGEDYIYDWSVKDNYRTRRMTPGDPIVFWVSGSAKATLSAGVWGVGYVTAPVNVEVTGELEAPDVIADDGYWLDLDAKRGARIFVKTNIQMLETPITRDRIRLVTELSNIEPLRQPQMSNPNWLNTTEWAALQDLLGEFALAPADPAEVGAWLDAAETQQPDPFTRRIIEVGAVAFVIEHLGEFGWEVEDVQGQNVGWDLTARRASEVARIEVKGRGLDSSAVLLSTNEIRAAQIESGWELAVVTGVLTSPKLSWYDSQAVLSVAEPITYRVGLQ
jgi:hypothetical protein